LARERLLAINFDEQCLKAGAEIVERDHDRVVARLRFIDSDYQLEYPEGEVRKLGGAIEPLPYDRILILHYLVHATGAPLSGELISYQQITDGWLYYPTFLKRVTNVLARTFAGDIEDFMDAGTAIGAKPSPLGNHALEIHAFPKVSYHLIMWPGGDELDTDFSCVFDRSISDYLPAEDITVLASVIASRLAQQSKKGGRHDP